MMMNDDLTSRHWSTIKLADQEENKSNHKEKLDTELFLSWLNSLWTPAVTELYLGNKTFSAYD